MLDQQRLHSKRVLREHGRELILQDKMYCDPDRDFEHVMNLIARAFFSHASYVRMLQPSHLSNLIESKVEFHLLLLKVEYSFIYLLLQVEYSFVYSRLKVEYKFTYFRIRKGLVLLAIALPIYSTFTTELIIILVSIPPIPSRALVSRCFIIRSLSLFVARA